jgi:hypothetical protein
MMSIMMMVIVLPTPSLSPRQLKLAGISNILPAFSNRFGELFAAMTRLVLLDDDDFPENCLSFPRMLKLVTRRALLLVLLVWR